jgi:hypothetical protein
MAWFITGGLEKILLMVKIASSGAHSHLADGHGNSAARQHDPRTFEGKDEAAQDVQGDDFE